MSYLRGGFKSSLPFHLSSFPHRAICQPKVPMCLMHAVWDTFSKCDWTHVERDLNSTCETWLLFFHLSHGAWSPCCCPMFLNQNQPCWLQKVKMVSGCSTPKRKRHLKQEKITVVVPKATLLACTSASVSTGNTVTPDCLAFRGHACTIGTNSKTAASTRQKTCMIS